MQPFLSVVPATIRLVTRASLSSGLEKSVLLRTPSGADALQWRSGDRLQTLPADRKLLEVPLVDGEPIRVGGQWQNRPNRHGLYYWAPTQTHVWHESALESACLMVLEFAGRIDRISAQPFRLLFRRGARSVRHDPDFFAVHRDGDHVVYDVKPLSRMSAEAKAQFVETARVCAAVGWRHEVLHEPDPVFARNLDFLRSARHRRCHPPNEVVEHILSVFEGCRSIGEARSMINRRSPALALPYIKHLIWHRLLAVDLTLRVDFDTVASSDPAHLEQPCCV